jgi:transposase-like protein
MSCEYWLWDKPPSVTTPCPYCGAGAEKQGAINYRWAWCSSCGSDWNRREWYSEV